MSVSISVCLMSCIGNTDHPDKCTCGQCPPGHTPQIQSASESRSEAELENDKEEVFVAVEQMPEFPGGEVKLLEVIESNINFPANAAEKRIQGRVVVKFVVKKDGNVGEVIVLRGKDPDLDKEAVRVVKSLPKFIPGKMNGQPVAVWYTVPVNFKLQMM